MHDPTPAIKAPRQLKADLTATAAAWLADPRSGILTAQLQRLHREGSEKGWPLEYQLALFAVLELHHQPNTESLRQHILRQLFAMGIDAQR